MRLRQGLRMDYKELPYLEVRVNVFTMNVFIVIVAAL